MYMCVCYVYIYENVLSNSYISIYMCVCMYTYTKKHINATYHYYISRNAYQRLAICVTIPQYSRSFLVYSSINEVIHCLISVYNFK